MANVVLQMSDVRTRYGDREVLRGVSLTIHSGEAHCLLGENGAGKTTLIRTILGRVRPDHGGVTVCGGIGLVPQDIALFPRLTARENLATFARLAGLPAAVIPSRVRDLCGKVGLSDRMDARVDTLSGGWRRRVNIAAAILHCPALLILDEPTVGVDGAARDGLHALVRHLTRQGMGVLMTTHDMAEAEAVCTHVAILTGGRLVVSGPIQATLRARFADRLKLSLALCPGTATQDLAAMGFEITAGSPTTLVADDADAMSVVSRVRAAGIGLEGFTVARPGLGRLYRTVLADAA